MKTPSYSEPPLPAHLTRRGVIFMLLSVTGFTANSLLLKYLGSNRELPAILPLLFRAGVGIVIVLTVFRGRRPGLGERRAFIGQVRLVADKRDGAAIAVLAQRKGGAHAALR